MIRPSILNLRRSYNAGWRGGPFHKTLHASEQHRDDVVKARDDWKKMQPTLDPKRLVFVDETGANTQMTRLRGRCAKGERLVDYALHGHWKTTTFVAGLRSDFSRIDDG